MSRPDVDNDPELSALQRLAQALDDAPDVEARERLIVWGIDRFNLFTSPDARAQLHAAVATVIGRLGIDRREVAIRIADELWGGEALAPDIRAERVERIVRALLEVER
jgi:hypothetical protein